MEPSFTIGIEEEYLLVDRETRDLAVDPPESFMRECEKRLKSRVSPEFMQSQIEIGTNKCASVAEAATELLELRSTVAEIAGKHGMAPIAASTHPFAEWYAQKHTRKDRYDILARDMQAVVRRLLICGMHVHVGLDDDDLRLDLMQQIAYFLPHKVGTVSYDQHRFFVNESLHCIEHVLDHWPPSDRVQHLGKPGFHARALTRGQNHHS